MLRIFPKFRKTKAVAMDDRDSLKEQGFVRIPQAVSPELASAALRRINTSLGAGIDPARLKEFQQQSFCPDLRSHPELLDLFNQSGLRELANRLIGDILPVKSCQIALRFPHDDSRDFKPHIDGIPYHNQKLPQHRISSFSFLVGVLLSDQLVPDAGNFLVYPATHWEISRLFREHGTVGFLKTGIPEVPLPKAAPILGKAGDAVVSHYSLLHTHASNFSANIRYMVYFRVEGEEHASNQEWYLSDPWAEWDL